MPILETVDTHIKHCSWLHVASHSGLYAGLAHQMQVHFCCCSFKLKSLFRGFCILNLTFLQRFPVMEFSLSSFILDTHNFPSPPWRRNTLYFFSLIDCLYQFMFIFILAKLIALSVLVKRSAHSKLQFPSVPCCVIFKFTLISDSRD